MNRWHIGTQVVCFILIICSWHTFYAEKVIGISFFSPRAQGADDARRINSWHCYRETDQSPTPQYTGMVTPHYNHSIKDIQIAQALFGTNILVVTGSAVPNRNPDSMIADYFGLSPLFNSFVVVAPSIRNVITDIELHASFGDYLPCFYAQANLPLTYTRWFMQMRETLQNGSLNSDFPANYMDTTAVAPPIHSFVQAFNGRVTFGQMQEPYLFGTITCPQTAFGLADARFMAGWHIRLSDYGRADLQWVVIVPTGTRPHSQLFFEPLVGNGRHWQFGPAFSGDVQLWERGGIQEVRFFADVLFSTLLKTDQCRSFDLCPNGFLSRFLLLKEFDHGTYTQHLVPAINRTTLPCKVSIDLECELAIAASYKYYSCFIDFGYNGWIRSKEKIGIKGRLAQNLGIKGLQNVSIGGIAVDNNTQSDATLFNDFISLADVPSPQLLTQNNLNPRSAASPRLVTHKLFFTLGQFGQTCCADDDSTALFCAIGGEIEFQGYNTRTSPYPDKTTLSQWGVWTKVGYVFG